MSRLSVRWVDSLDQWPELATRWADLFAADGVDRTPFLAPEWAEAWLRVFGGRPRIAVVERDGRLVGLAPLMRVGAVVPTYVGIGQEVADYGGFLHCEPVEEVTAALLGAVERRLLSGAALVHLGRLPIGAALHSAVVARYANHARLELSAWQQETAPVLDLTNNGDARRLVEKLKKRNDVRRRLRRLTDEHRVEFVYDTSRDPRALGDFLHLHDLRWQGKDRDPVGPFVSARGRRFLQEVIGLMAPSGLVRVSFVEVDSRRLVGRFGFELDGTYYGSKSAFDPTLAPYGPGHLAVAFLLDEMLARGLTRFDFMRGEGAHKAAWTRESTPVTYYVLHHRSPRGAMERRLSAARSARRYRWPWTITGRRLRTTAME